MTARNRFAAAVGVTALASASVVAGSYVVRPGDTLHEIAVRHGTTVRDLVNANHIANPNLITAGQMLQIPDATLGLPSYAADEDAHDIYEVKPGEGLIQIARYYGVDATALARTNGIGVNEELNAGAILHVPGQHVRSNALLVQVAEDHNVDPKLTKAVAWMESGWQQNVVSPTGAVGMMQIEPYTGDWVSTYIAHRNLNINIALDNVTAGTLLLNHLLQIHDGDIAATLGAYYQGDSSIAQHGLYADTQRYQRVVMDLMARD